MVEGKVVAITGASAGIGEATAELLAERGAKVVLGARRPDRLEALATRIAAAGGEVAWLITDVRERADVRALVDLARSRFGRLDVLVGNAGIMPVSPLDELRVDSWDDMIDVNIKGVLHGIAAALPVFREQRSGQFVHTASVSGHHTVPGQAVYSGTKFAVRAISEGLRQEAGPELRVTIVSPGITHTDFGSTMESPELKARLVGLRDQIAMPARAVARAIAYAIEQPDDVDVNEVIIRPTAQA
ncbi:SDR family oxidoreductase [Amycolatopsis lurida]